MSRMSELAAIQTEIEVVLTKLRVEKGYTFFQTYGILQASMALMEMSLNNRMAKPVKTAIEAIEIATQCREIT